jgi:two-component system NtrC family sensor kinase
VNADLVAAPVLPVLVVDDEEEPRRATTRLLQSGGLRASSVERGEAALAALEAAEFGVVISDYRMPGMDGVKLLARVRDGWPDAERILMTGAADADVLERGVNEAGISRFVKKPWVPAALLGVVNEALRAAQLRREHRVLGERLRHRNEELSYVNDLLQQRVAEDHQAGADLRSNGLRRRWDVAFGAISDPVTIVREGFILEGVNMAAAALAGRASDDLEGRRCHEALFGRREPCKGCPLPTGTGQVHEGQGVNARAFDARAYSLPGPGAPHLCVYRDISRDVALSREAAQLEKMAAIGRVAGGVAHEINNPLHGILSFVQLAQKPDVPREKMTRYLEVIRECAVRCRDIVQSMRDFARRSHESSAHEFDLRRACLRATVPFEPVLGARLEKQLGDELDGGAQCIGTPLQLQQVVANLMQNAVDASPPGGRVRITLAEDDGHWLIAVDDEGPGVPEDRREKIFEPFYTTKPEGVGTGLGLAISHTILREHKGSLRVTRSPLGGARFEARLPRLRAERPAENQQHEKGGAHVA